MRNPESAARISGKGPISAAPSDSETSLLSLPPGSIAAVAAIDGDTSVIDQLIGHGIVEAALLEVESRLPLGGPLLVRVGRARIAVPRALARHVRVRPVSAARGES